MHATTIAVLCVIPVATTQRFSSRGQLQVISIDASQSVPEVASVAVSVDPVAPMKSLDRPLEDPFRVPEPTDRLESQKRLSPQASPDLKFEPRPVMQRREFASVPPPQPVAKVMPPRPPATRRISRPPVEVRIPIEQFAGLEEETLADLSKNQPPGYPLQAVRLKLEGVVMLRLRIAVTGLVASIELIKSSGHPMLDQAAIDAVKRWEGKPARRWGQPIESSVRLPVRFRL